MLRRMFNLLITLISPSPVSVVETYLKRLERLHSKLQGFADKDKVAVINETIVRIRAELLTIKATHKVK